MKKLYVRHLDLRQIFYIRFHRPDFISDHMVLHAFIRSHPVRKQISVRALRRIKDDALAEHMDKFNVDQVCVDMDIMIEQYDTFLSELLDKHVPEKNIYVVDRPLIDAYTNNILALKAFRCKLLL